MRKTIVVLAMLALVVPALADTIAVSPQATHGIAGGQVPSDRGIVVYDNTTNFTGWAASYSPGAWIGDELLLSPGGGTLETAAVSITNFADGILSFVDLELQFYDGGSLAYLGSFTFPSLDIFTLNGGADLIPGYAVFYQTPDLSAYNLVLPADVLAIQVMTNPSGTATTWSMGPLIVDPPTVGSSGDYFYVDTTVATPPGTQSGWYWFGGDPVANFFWQITVTPEPASFGLLALGAIALIRRR